MAYKISDNLFPIFNSASFVSSFNHSTIESARTKILSAPLECKFHKGI